MDRLNFYSGQLVDHNDLNTLESNIENKDKELVQKLVGYGIVEGFNVVSNSPADLTVLVNPGYAVDQYGQTIKLLTQKQINLASCVPSSNNRYVTLYAKFARKEHETRTNDIGEEFKYRQDEDCEIVIAVGEVGANPVKPNIPPEGILLADVLLSSGQTQITTTDNTRRQNLINMLIHQIDKNNPHQVKLSQLADYTLSADMNANGKRITGLPAASSSSEPVRKQEFDTHINNVSNPHQVKMSQLADYTLSADMNANGKKITGLPAASGDTDAFRKKDYTDRIIRYAYNEFYPNNQVITPSAWTYVNNSSTFLNIDLAGKYLILFHGTVYVHTSETPATWEWNIKITDLNNNDIMAPSATCPKTSNPWNFYAYPINHLQVLNLGANSTIGRRIFVHVVTSGAHNIRLNFGALMLLAIPLF